MVQYPILLNISILSLLLPIIAGIVRLRVLNQELRLFVIYILLAFIISICNWFASDIWKKIAIQINTVIEFVFIMTIVGRWQESRQVKIILNVILWSYVLFWFFSKLTFEPIDGLYSITASISQAILALSAGYTLFIVIANYTQSLHQYQKFWILIGLILNYTGTLLPTTLAGLLFTQPGEEINLLFSLTWCLIIISNILFAIGILCPQTQQ